MYVKIANKLANLLLLKKAIEKEKLEIYTFGLEMMVADFFGILFLLLAGILLNAVLEAALFYIVFMLVRKYAGGYHASTYTRCNSLYLLTFAATVLLAREIIPLWDAVSPLLAGFAFLTVVLLAPIENPNNPIARGMEKRYCLYAYGISLSLLALTCILFFTGIHIHRMLAAALFFAAIYMYVEIIKRRTYPMFSIQNKLCKAIAAKAEKKAEASVREVSANKIYQAKAPAALLKSRDEK